MTSKTEDALDLLLVEDQRLRELFDGWVHNHEGEDTGGDSPADAATRAWNRGTIAKIILEEAASRIVAVDEIGRVLRSRGQDSIADALERHQAEAKSLLRDLDDAAHGVVAEALRYSDEFHSSMERLVNLWFDEVHPDPRHYDQLAEALGSDRARLPSARHLRKRAPLHPALRRHWYQRLPLVERLHAIYDHIRSLPDAASQPSSRVTLTRRYRQPPR